MLNRKLKDLYTKLEEEHKMMKERYAEIESRLNDALEKAKKYKCAYETARSLNQEKDKLIEEVQEREATRAKENGCEMGVWCRDCKHCRYGMIEYEQWLHRYPYVPIVDLGKEKMIQYCDKWLHDICKGWEKNT